mmetsp:Transcript_102874/g.188265  ORF Transcript_102874/g.188265 Transcript_102874/m.188265 type:complete len:203 (+) Transcript_102874:106-714(+)
MGESLSTTSIFADFEYLRERAWCNNCALDTLCKDYWQLRILFRSGRIGKWSFHAGWYLRGSNFRSSDGHHPRIQAPLAHHHCMCSCIWHYISSVSSPWPVDSPLCFGYSVWHVHAECHACAYHKCHGGDLSNTVGCIYEPSLCVCHHRSDSSHTLVRANTEFGKWHLWRPSLPLSHSFLHSRRCVCLASCPCLPWQIPSTGV